MRKRFTPGLALAGLFTLGLAGPASALEVGITSDLDKLEVPHGDETVTIKRNQDTENWLDNEFAMTSRPCPPFCVQPMELGRGVETLGEIEFLDYLAQLGERDDLMIIDSREPHDYAAGTIPGAINIPWQELHMDGDADPADVRDRLVDEFNVMDQWDLLDFSDAKTLVLFCNGPWCGQSPTNIRTLTNLGYPGHKIKWYRGGMQMWHNLGLTVVEGQ
ncbi:rhodanese-like domain-containing protein [Thioalkalivibrio sp. ALJ24]|uniref:rhodanese-like domain-containing protein n=1 Tax=Thioalkalivibrio sp. ALJ24 TaxID=545276 RepID=UPI0003677963|nr:rhodanese-like domain-containing protein [Thioalkalivibrio sp. ALJ24]